MRSPGIAVVLLIASVSFAQFRPSIPSADPPRNAVREYCRLDFMGSRLTAQGWPRIKPLTGWKENPEWHGFTVVSRFEVIDTAHSFHSARVTVQYQVLGRFEPGIGFTPEPGSQEVEFRVKEAADEWRIDSTDPAMNPHISRQRAIEWLQSVLSTEKNPANRIGMEKALEQLQAK